MIYILLKDGKAIEARDNCNGISNWSYSADEDGWIHRSYLKSFEQVELYAAQLSKTPGEFLGAQRSSTDFEVIRCPAVGDEVSYSFNGDTTPCGKIVRLTPKLMVITDAGYRFNRRGNSASWYRIGGKSWCLVHGHIEERNPHF